jgi:hypothetical protein
MQSGELVVTGKDKVEIDLGHRHPKSVIVKFSDDCVIVPCNPRHHDELRWDVKNRHHKHPHDARHDHCKHRDEYILTIKWHVTGVRTIEWVAYY